MTKLGNLFSKTSEKTKKCVRTQKLFVYEHTKTLS